MARHFNVTIEPHAPYGRSIIWPDLAKHERRNISRPKTAANHLWRTCYECLEGLALRDRPIAYQARDWALATPAKLKKNDREAFTIGDFIIAIERWDN